MAPIGTVVKNGLLFAILSAPFIYGGAVFLSFGLLDLSYATDNGGTVVERNEISNDRGSWYTVGIFNIFLGLFLAIVGTGIVYMKSLSDTVEDGMIEF